MEAEDHEKVEDRAQAEDSDTGGDHVEDESFGEDEIHQYTGERLRRTRKQKPRKVSATFGRPVTSLLHILNAL